MEKSNNFDVKSNNEIEKIKEILKDYTKKHNIMASVVILEDYAKELVEKGICSLVRCKNCKHWTNTSFDPITEDHWGECRKPLGDYRYCETAENDYCSYGEMKGGE